MMDKSDSDIVISADAIEMQIAEADALRVRWIGYLTTLRDTGRGRLRLGDRWEETEESARRIQQVIDSHSRTTELLKGFRTVWAPDSAAKGRLRGASKHQEPSHEQRSVGPEDETRGGPQALERPEIQTDD